MPGAGTAAAVCFLVVAVSACADPEPRPAFDGGPDVAPYVPDPSVCRGDASVAGLEVRVQDREGTTVCDATVTAHRASGGNVSRLESSGGPGCIHAGLAGEEGRFVVSVHRDGCEDVTSGNVSVTGTSCPTYPDTTTLVVKLNCVVEAGTTSEAGHDAASPADSDGHS